MLVIIDHYDSFVDTIHDYCKNHVRASQIIKTDQIDLIKLNQLQPSHIIIGPGPGHPQSEQLHAAIAVISYCVKRQIPLLGICLGHQLIAEYFGAKVIGARKIAHGLISKIQHNHQGLFTNLPKDLQVTRYHSLIVANETIVNSELRIDAITADNEIMAISHKRLPIYGVQFHPESIMSEGGHQLLAKFLHHNKASDIGL